MAQTTCRPATLRWLAYTLLLFGSWNFNLLTIPDPATAGRAEIRTGHLGHEANLVVSRVVIADQRPLLYPLVYKPDDNSPGYTPYRSQFGLVGVVLGALKVTLPVSSAALLHGSAAIQALLTAMAVAAVFARAGRWLPPVAGDVACALAVACPVFLSFAPSLYTQLVLLLGPFLLAWCLGDWANTRARRALLLAGVGLAVMAKSLAGYEYITTTILAPVAAAWFHQSRAASTLARRFAGAAAVVGVGLLGFALALGIHAVQVKMILNEDGLAFVQARATERTTGDPGPGADPDARTFRYATAKFLDYGEMPVLTLPGVPAHVRRSVPLKLAVGISAALAVGAWLVRRRLPPAAVALAGATVIGLGASVSWQVLAVNHMCAHHHLNLVVFAVPFLPLAFLLTGTVVGSCLPGRCREPSGTAAPPGHAPGPSGSLPTRVAVRLGSPDLPSVGSRWGIALLAGIVVLMGVTGVREVLRDRETVAARAIAERTALEAALRTDVVRADRVTGHMDRYERVGNLDRYMLMAVNELDLNTDRPFDPDAVILHGWASAGAGRRDDVLTELVVVRGGAVVPCHVQRLRRADLDQQAGVPVRDAGFAVCVPSWAVRGERPRLFTVSRSDPTRITELPIRWE